MDAPVSNEFKNLSIEELEELIAEREERIRPALDEISALKRTRAAKLARAARTANQAAEIARQEAEIAALREQYGGGRGVIPELVRETGLKERTVHRRLDAWRATQPTRWQLTYQDDEQ